MKRCIKVEISPKVQQWLWFAGLWLGGFIGLGIIASLIKLMMFEM